MANQGARSVRRSQGQAWVSTVVMSVMVVGAAAGMALAAEPRTVVMVLDASGSMNAALGRGANKLDAARAALGQVVAGLPATTSVGLRAYGHRSPRSAHDCRDTELLVPIGAASAVRAQVVAKAASLQARGYTPITIALEAAAKDFPADAREHVIVLISDGKETCEGDPCAAARALAQGQAKVVIHTVGFGVDSAARGQLECIAHASGGRYFDASGAAELSTALAEAARAEAAPTPVASGEGTLRVKGAGLRGHIISDATTGKEVGRLSHVRESISLPAGIYSVTVGSAAWKSVEVRGGQTTVLEPGHIVVKHASIRGHKVVDVETDSVHAEISASYDRAVVIPGTYDVTFGALVWPNVIIAAGAEVVLEPGTIQVKGASINGHRIATAAGADAGLVSAILDWLPLPPGRYTVDLDGTPTPVTLAVGQDVVLTRR